MNVGSVIAYSLLPYFNNYSLCWGGKFKLLFIVMREYAHLLSVPVAEFKRLCRLIIYWISLRPYQTDRILIYFNSLKRAWHWH